MDDTISRQAAVSCISDLLMLELKGERLPTYNEVYRAIYDLPSADAVEVVRCKDCKYASPNGIYGCRLERFSSHDKSERLFAEDYCSLAERREE